MKKELGFRIRCISNLIKRTADLSPAKAQMEHVTGMHGWIIGYLYDHQNQEIFQRDLEKAFQMRRSTATGILQLMEKNELIKRKSVPQDARLKKLTLTPKAHMLHEQFGRDIQRIEETMIQGLSPEELETINRILDKISHNLLNLEKQINETEEHA